MAMLLAVNLFARDVGAPGYGGNEITSPWTFRVG
jgi:hypothetical protein